MMLVRREALRLGGAVVATGLAAACTPAPRAQPTQAAVPVSGPLPTYLPPSGGQKPDFHSADPRITDGFINYPAPVKTWNAPPPGAGGTLNVFVPAYYPQPAAHDQNPTWQQVEKALNTSVNMTITAMADYSTRLQVVMAANDLPDTIHVVGTVANLISPQFVDAQCADLTPFLSGDAAKDYPNLAAIPGYAYQGRGLQQNPRRHFTIVKPFASEAGGKPQHFLTAGTVAYNLVKKANAERVKEVLRILNYLAAPFGSEEDVLLTYGLRDQDYSMDASGNSIPTQQGLLNATYVPWQYVAHRPYAWYQSDLPGYAKAAFEVEQVLVGVGISNPTVGLHSATQAKNVASEQTFYDGLADILFNRRPFSDYDRLVADWRSSVGDTIRQEYLAEIQRKG